ncbi:MAG TPA: LysR substrate-binding domain-containing protein, partial [Polyangiaceae bacterium]|nr:LysR substrate-binding domain-containing protein [Polyangiaceae bacterium]
DVTVERGARPSVRQLECLVAAAKHLNFRAAARECHISQPALSSQIAHLEAALGVVLFERSRRRVLLTPVGGALVERAKRLLADLDDMRALAQSHAEPLGGQLRLGVIPTIAPFLMPQALPLLRRACPGLELLLREEQTARSLSLLDEGKLDAVLLALEAELGDVTTLPLFRDPFVFAAGAGHPLSNKKLVRAADLRAQRVLLLEDGHCLKDQAWAICQAEGVRDYVDFRATSLATLAQMVSSGAGVTLLPLLSVPTVGTLPGLVVKPFAKPVPYRTIGIVWRPTSPRRALFEAIGTVLRELAPS